MQKENSALKKDLRLIDIFSIATGAMISSGLFVLPGIAHAKAGPAVVISYFLAGMLALTGILSQAELVSAMPKAGGTYFYVTRSMGPILGTIEGLLDWMALSFKSAFALIGIGAFLSLISNFNIHIAAISLSVIFILINYFGVKKAGILQTIMVLLLISLLVFYIIDGISAIKIQNFERFSPGGLKAIFATAGFVFISYGGIMKVASVAEEVENPSRAIPRGMIFSFTAVLILYMFVVFVTSGVLENTTLNNSLTPITDGAEVIMGYPGKIIMSIAAILAFVSTANAGIMSAARYPMALSRDKLLPDFFSRVSKKYSTPSISLLVTGSFIILILFLKLDILVKAASTILILSFIMACFSVIILKESRVQNYRPSFKSPFYPWLQIIGIIGFITLLFEMGHPALFTTAILILCGGVLYFSYGKKSVTKEFALVHLVERIMDKKLASNILESELKEIIRERDEIVKDRFDKMIEQSIVLDIQGKIGLREFFETASRAISRKINKAPSEIYSSLMAREKDTSTALNPFLAIPHIIIDGKNVFEVLVARCKDGIKFSDENKNVKAVFILIGTKDQRNFHLKSLSAIAQIVQNEKFEQMWEKAKGPDNLRDIILLGERQRNDQE
ncbi:MAG: amino acid permease [Elusimicrobiota bacterium]